MGLLADNAYFNANRFGIVQGGVERLTIEGYGTNAGNVGIGTGSPSEKLEVAGNMLLNASNAELNLQSGVNGTIGAVNWTFNTSSTNYASAKLSYDDRATTGLHIKSLYPITIDSTGQGTKFNILGSEKARIDGSGNLLVGTTSDQTGSSTGSGGTYIGGAGSYLGLSRANGVVQYSNRIGSDGDIAVFRKDGSTVGSIGNHGADVYVGTSDTGIRFNSVSNSVTPYNPSSGANRSDAIDLGFSAIRYKDLYLSGGVYLGGTGAANKLDDYEEGTWTPAITGSTTAGSYTSVTAQGYYTKIGNLVTVTGIFFGLSGTGAGDMQITNLPFSLISGADAVGILQANDGAVYPTGTVDACLFGAGSSTLKVRCNKSDGSTYEHMAYPTTAGYLRFSLTYRTAA
jgi:hypothetical protein